MSYLIKCVLVCGIADSSRNQQLAAASSQASKTSNTTTWREDGQKDRLMLSQDSSPRYLIGMYFDFLLLPSVGKVITDKCSFSVRERSTSRGGGRCGHG